MRKKDFRSSLMSSLMLWNLQYIQQLFWVKECDIFRGSKHTLTPRSYFHGVMTPVTPGSTPWVLPCVLSMPDVKGRNFGLLLFFWLHPILERLLFATFDYIRQTRQTLSLDSKRVWKTAKIYSQWIDFTAMMTMRTDSIERHSVTVTCTIAEDLTASDWRSFAGVDPYRYKTLSVHTISVHNFLDSGPFRYMRTHSVHDRFRYIRRSISVRDKIGN